jgi:hypothetical protein
MAAPDKAQLLSRLQELHTQGKTWKEIAQVLDKEGYNQKGEPLTTTALRKRYSRWSRTGEGGPGKALMETEPVPKQVLGGYDFDQFQKSRMESPLNPFEGGAALPAPFQDNPLASSIASLVTLSKQLLEQVQLSHRMIEKMEKRLEAQKPKTTHTGIDTEQLVTSRDLLELLRDLSAGKGQHMQYIEEKKEYYVSREEVQQLFDELLPDKVDAELKTVLEGEPVKTLISKMLDERLRAYMGGITVKEQHSGPGRGRTGKTHKKFSASLPEDLFEEVKSLPGMFSAHLDAALRLYLKMTKGDVQ